MGVLRRRSFLATAFTLLFMLFASLNYLGSTSSVDNGRGQRRQKEMTEQSKFGSGLPGRFLARKLLMVGPGSSPPTCKSMCGWCAPCRAVHVPIQPGFVIPLEYYPEAWRCKCGNKLYMP